MKPETNICFQPLHQAAIAYYEARKAHKAAEYPFATKGQSNAYDVWQHSL